MCAMTNSHSKRHINKTRVRLMTVLAATGVGTLIASAAMAAGTDVSAVQRPGSEPTSTIAQWAASQGLSGLSPASLTPVRSAAPSVDADGAAIAKWAISQGLAGLSPASLQPIDD